jgi:pilus assembly protein CpaB
LKRRMLTIVLAGLLAVAGAVAVLAYVGQANKRAVVGNQAVTVLAATSSIRAGTPLREAKSDLIIETVPRKSLSAVPVTKVGPGNENKVLSGPLGKGQLLLQPMLTSAAKRAPSTVIIPGGKVAVTIALCIPEAVAGWVTAQSRVDVFGTYTPHNANNPPTLQRTCNVGHQVAPGGTVDTQQIAGLSDLEVLSVGVASPGGPSASSAISSVQALSENSSVTTQGAVLITLAVDPTVAGKLIQLAEVGMPYLALNASISEKPSFSGTTTLFPG